MLPRTGLPPMGELVERGTHPMLGRCPRCEVPIPRGGLLIEYETADGWPQMYAECPSCAEVVHPR